MKITFIMLFQSL